MNRDIGKIQKGIQARNRQEVYEAICVYNREVKLSDIIAYLEMTNEMINKNIIAKAEGKYQNGQFTEKERDDYIKRKMVHTISAKTIQRCISNDPRIVSNGRKYRIPQKARFESRYLEPEYFGRQMIHEVIGKLRYPEPLEKGIKHFVLRFGAYVLFNFIEAVKPFHDHSLSVGDREDLVPYWAREAIPLDYMFELFLASFDNRTRHERRSHDWKTPISEMSVNRIKEISLAMQKIFPEIYGDLQNARRKAFGKTIKEVGDGIVTDIGDDLYS